MNVLPTVLRGTGSGHSGSIASLPTPENTQDIIDNESSTPDPQDRSTESSEAVYHHTQPYDSIILHRGNG